MITSETTAEVFAALVSADLPNPLKSQEVKAGARSYSFAPLPDILDLVVGTLALHGLKVIQQAHTIEGFAGVTTRIIHTSGEWIEFAPLFIPSAADAQSMGSVITYARRYTLCAALGIAADDDDDGAKGMKPRTLDPVLVRANVGTGGSGETTAATTVPPVSAPTSGAGEAPDEAGGGGSAPSSPVTQDALIKAFGSSAKALVRARKTWPEVTSLHQLDQEQMRTLLQEAT